MPGEERTEQATPRRRQDAREKGQVAKSMELCAALGLLAALLAVKWFGGNLVTNWQQLAADHLMQIGRFPELTATSVQVVIMDAGAGFLRLVMPVLCCVMVTGLVANLMQTGLIFSPQTLAPDFARLNPAQGFARMFSARAAMDLLKSSAKALVLAYVIYTFFREHNTQLTRLAWINYTELGPGIAAMCLGLLLKAASLLLVIAGIDYMFQRWQFEKSLRMTKEEIKEEYKRMEGDPLIKARTRQRQRELAQRRMMAEVPKATVVITNPTHYAVALRYEPNEMAAPQVIAKGQNLIAQKIKELAKTHGIPVVENKPLARAMFANCAIGAVVPVEMYEAVAEIIAFVFKQTGRRVTRRTTPTGG